MKSGAILFDHAEDTDALSTHFEPTRSVDGGQIAGQADLPADQSAPATRVSRNHEITLEAAQAPGRHAHGIHASIYRNKPDLDWLDDGAGGELGWTIWLSQHDAIQFSAGFNEAKVNFAQTQSYRKYNITGDAQFYPLSINYKRVLFPRPEKRLNASLLAGVKYVIIGDSDIKPVVSSPRYYTVRNSRNRYSYTYWYWQRYEDQTFKVENFLSLIGGLQVDYALKAGNISIYIEAQYERAVNGGEMSSRYFAFDEELNTDGYSIKGGVSIRF